MQANKGVITKAEGNHYYIRYYGNIHANSPGFDADLDENGKGRRLIEIKGEDHDLKVGDFVSTQYFENREHYGFTIEKFEPTDNDVKENAMLQEYLDAISEQAGNCYEELLLQSRKDFESEKQLNGEENKYNIILSDEQISELINKYRDSIKTFGISGGSGRIGFGIQLQLGYTQDFDEERCDYSKYFGVDTAPCMQMMMPSCISRRFFDSISWFGEKGDLNNYGGSAFFSIYDSKGSIFRVSISKESGVLVDQPYQVGYFANQSYEEKRRDRE